VLARRGATRFVGSAVVSELLGAGHEVVGLARSKSAAESHTAAGAEVHAGSLEDLVSLAAGAAEADGIVHVAFTNVSPTTDYATAARADAAAVGALGDALVGTARPLVVTSGSALVSVSGRMATEEDPASWGPRVAGEEAVHALVKRGVHASIVRLASSVHDGQADRRSFVPRLLSIARGKGVSAYVAGGGNRWTGIHRLDARCCSASPSRRGRPGRSTTASPTRVCPSERSPRSSAQASVCQWFRCATRTPSATSATGHRSSTLDDWTLSEQTKVRLGWRPERIGLIADIEDGDYLP